ncbi:MAG: arylesterase [Gammaproteobacteria bacterium]|nr:arylesterase [Gammaproteobacteria bacterium]
MLNVSHADNISKSSSLENTIIILGDSLSAAYGIEIEQGWVNLLRTRLNNDNSMWNVINASISGDTTSGGLARLERLIRQHQPVLCIIALGANDGLRGQSLTLMKNNLDKMVTKCSTTGTSLLLGIKLPPNYGEKYTQAFHQVFSDVAENSNILYVPFMLEGIALQEKYFQADGLHPTAEAQPKILENIWDKLQTVLTMLKAN